MMTTSRLPVRLALPSTLLLVGLLVGGCTGLTTVQVESELEKLRFYPNMHVVQAGDTLETVAFRYRLETAELAALNPGVSDIGLRAGMRINVRPGTELPDEVRQRARLAAGPERLSDSRSARVAVAPSPPAEPLLAPAPAAPAGVGVQQPTTVIATAPARQAERFQEGVPGAPTNRMPDASGSGATGPDGAPDMVIREARWQAPQGGYPKEEVIPDDLGPLPDAGEPLAAYTPVPGGMGEPSRPAGGWVWPTLGQVARGFSPDRVDGQGIDIAGLPGQDVRAAADGTVIYSGKSLTGDGGNLVILRHEEGLMTTYAHADRLFVTEDDVVRAGDPIASLGANEASESVLSFEVRRAGQPAPLDPLQFVRP